MSRPGAPARPLKVVVLNNSKPVLQLLCQRIEQQGHQCFSALMPDMRNVHEEVPRLIARHTPDVVVYDVAIPYQSSWDVLELIRSRPELSSQPFVVTTPNKTNLDAVVGSTGALEISDREADLGRLVSAVEASAV